MAKDDKARFGRLALGDERRLTAGYAHHRAPAFSRDGKLLATAVGGEHDASWVLIDKRGRVARTLEGPAAGAACFAPDGSLAFERRFGPTSEIWLTPGSDAPPVRLLGGDGRFYRDPVFSPDGGALACAVGEEPGAPTQLVLVLLGDGQRVPITHGNPDGERRSDRAPAFFPGGQELCFEGVIGTDHAIYSVSLAGGGVRRLTPSGERSRRPAVIDDALLVYERQPEQGPSTLVLLDRARGRAQVIVEDGASRCHPASFVNARGKVKLAYARRPTAEEATRAGEPPRFDVFAARLRGVQLEGAKPRAKPAPAPTIEAQA